jgi:hypothetical protein
MGRDILRRRLLYSSGKGVDFLEHIQVH